MMNDPNIRVGVVDPTIDLKADMDKSLDKLAMICPDLVHL